MICYIVYSQQKLNVFFHTKYSDLGCYLPVWLRYVGSILASLVD